MQKILIFRTDRLGDFILTKESLNYFFFSKEKFKVDMVVSKYIYEYAKYFKTINNFFIFDGSYLDFFQNHKKIFKKKYDYILICDGKNRSHIISFFIKGKKITFIKRKKNNKILEILNYDVIFNSEKKVQLKTYQGIYNKLNIKESIDTPFYFEYQFGNYKEIDLVPQNSLFFHFDEKWFTKYYINDFETFDWTKDFFENFLVKLYTNIKLPIVITTGSKKIEFIEEIKSSFFYLKKNNIFFHNNYQNNVIFLDNLDFRNLEFVLKKKCKLLICNHGAISHLANNLGIKHFDFVQGTSEFMNKHWTGHMSNVNLILRADSKEDLLLKLEQIKY